MLMASKSKFSPDINQPAIANFINRTRTNSVTRGPSSPPEDRPQAKRFSMENQSEDIVSQETKEKLASLPPDLKLLHDSLKLQLDNIDRKIDRNLSVRVENVETTQERTNTRLNKVEQENKELKQRLTEIEDKLLEKSITINGISEEKYEDPGPRRIKLNHVIAHTLSGNTFDEKLEKASSMQIESTERIGKYNPSKGRPIAVNFMCKTDADTVLLNKKKLTKGIYADHYYSVETERERKRLRPILSAARRLEEFRGKCRMDGTELVIRGKRYTMKNLSELPQNLSPELVSSKQDADHYGFFGEFNPLSNFHPAEFTHEGITYQHSEQFIQATKANFCGDKESLKQILITESAYKCKDLGRNITNCNIVNWNSNAKRLCLPGLLSKFEQNSGLAAFLKNTGNKSIIECCYDDVWGNGKPLSDPECIDSTKYSSQGILGEMLEEIRDILRTKAIMQVGNEPSQLVSSFSSTCGNNPPPIVDMTGVQHD